MLPKSDWHFRVIRAQLTLIIGLKTSADLDNFYRLTQLGGLVKEALIKSHKFWQRQNPESRHGHAAMLIAFQMTITQSLFFLLSLTGQGYRLSSSLLHFL